MNDYEFLCELGDATNLTQGYNFDSVQEPEISKDKYEDFDPNPYPPLPPPPSC